MAILLVTIVALLLAAHQLHTSFFGIAGDWKSGGGAVAAALCALLVELAVWPASFPRRFVRVRRIRLLASALQWIGFNALVAAVCGCGLVLLLVSPLLDPLRGLQVMAAALIVEFVGVTLIGGLVWHRRIIGTPLTGKTLSFGMLRVAGVNATSVATALLVGLSWSAGYDWVEDRRHASGALRFAEAIAAARADTLCADTTAIIVARFERNLPSDSDKLRRCLWDNFANRPAERQFRGCTTEGWEARYWLFASALVRRAQASGLDTASLDRCLKSLFPHANGPAYLPIGAYQAKRGHTIAWIIVIKWESGPPDPRVRLSHIRIYALDAETTQQIGYVSCM